MAISITHWELSDRIAEDSIPVEEGLRTLQIRGARYDPDSDTYIVTFKDLGNKALFTITYWLSNLEQDGVTRTPNNMSLGTIHSMNYALTGLKGIAPLKEEDIKGGVVIGDVKFSKPNANGKTFPRIYHFEPVPEDVAVLSEIDQYWEGRTDMEYEYN